jgi:ABC-type sugar transport system permease subunit
MSNSTGFAVIIVIMGLIATYFLPTIIALILRRKNTLAIFMLDLFLGWSLIGWVIALVWAVAKDKDQTIIIQNMNTQGGTNDSNNPKSPIENQPTRRATKETINRG